MRNVLNFAECAVDGGSAGLRKVLERVCVAFGDQIVEFRLPMPHSNQRDAPFSGSVNSIGLGACASTAGGEQVTIESGECLDPH